MVFYSYTRKFIILFLVFYFFLFIEGNLFSASSEGLKNLEPISFFWIIPFASLLLCISLFPLVLPHFWHKNYWKITIFLFTIPMLFVCFFLLNDAIRSQTFHEIQAYTSFILLISSLFIISSAIYIHIYWTGNPIVNTLILTKGSILASFIGTTGAAMLLIRPLLKANHERKYRTHIFIFFIIIVANTGGILTPLGDPPLFLGYLRGVPFTWTFNHLFTEWLFVNLILLSLFFLLESFFFKKESDLLKEKANKYSLSVIFSDIKNIKIEGKIQFLLILTVILSIYFHGFFIKLSKSNPNFYWPHFGPQEIAMISVIIISLLLSRPDSSARRKNEFSWEPIREVAVLFSGIFASMIPTLYILDFYGSHLNVDQAWEFFWMTGILSSFLDNAPTYLVFLQLAQSVLNTDIIGLIQEGTLLKAISSGAVFMGALSYIGNAPNFMIFSIIKNKNIYMPSFFGYMFYALCILIPLFILVTLVFFPF